MLPDEPHDDLCIYLSKLLAIRLRGPHVRSTLLLLLLCLLLAGVVWALVIGWVPKKAPPPDLWRTF